MRGWKLLLSLDANLLCVIKKMKEGARLADEQGDTGTVDVFAKMVQVHEKHEWFLHQILKGRDGPGR